jgi:hypothetical protein
LKRQKGEKFDEILGAVPEHRIRSKVEDVLKRFPTNERGKLKVILSSWIEHTKQHSEKFRKWREKVKNVEGNPIYSSISQAAEEMGKLNERLSQLFN